MVEGDDILGELDDLMAGGERFENMDTGEDLATVRDRVSSANVYLGAFPSVCGSGYYPVTIGIMALNLESGARTAFTRLTCLP